MPTVARALHPCLLHFTPPTVATLQGALLASPSTHLPPCPGSLHNSTQIIFYKTKEDLPAVTQKSLFSPPHHQDKDSAHTLAHHGWLANNCEGGC